MIIAGDRYVLTEKEINMYAIEMVLHIKRLQTSDFGGYKCISKNSIGDTEGTIRLYGKACYTFSKIFINLGIAQLLISLKLCLLEMERPGRKGHMDEDLNDVTVGSFLPIIYSQKRG